MAGWWEEERERRRRLVESLRATSILYAEVVEHDEADMVKLHLHDGRVVSIGAGGVCRDEFNLSFVEGR